MEKELNLLVHLLENREDRIRGAYRYIRGTVGSHEVTLTQCGIGKVNAALATRAVINECEPELVINTGVAGGTGEAGVLDVVVGNAVAYHDVYMPGSERGQVEGLPRLFTAPQEILKLPVVSSGAVKTGLIASGDQFVDSVEQLRQIMELYPDALAVDMESAAVAQTCWLAGVRFLALRVVSDTPGHEEIGRAHV